MTEFSIFYKNGIDCIAVPEYSLEDLRSIKGHKKYVKQKKLKEFAAAVLFVVIVSAVASVTAYAAYTIQKNIHFTSYGVKIDFSNPTSSQLDFHVHEYNTDHDIPTPYSVIYTDPVYKQEDFTDDPAEQLNADSSTCYTFDNWTDAQKEIDFPIVFPKNLQYSELNIALYQYADCKLVEAVYTASDKVLEINYTYYYLNSNWSFAKDYNAQIIEESIYTNQYQHDFWITECQYDVSKITHAITYINDYTIELSFYGYETEEIYEVLDEFDLSIYQ